MGMRVLVTGASGFIGGILCAELLERGHELSALVRRPGSERDGTRPVSGDLSDAVRLSEAVRESAPQCVVHLAAEIASQRSERKVLEVNVAGMRNLLDGCVALAGADGEEAPRVVFCSSVVTGEANGALLKEETSLPVQTPYGRSKQEGERLLRASGLPAVILRPSHVYGAGGWYADELIPRLRQPGRFAVIGSGANLWDVVHVQDVVAALVLGVESAPAGSTYHVVDGQPITFYDFMATTAAELGVGAPSACPRRSPGWWRAATRSPRSRARRARPTSGSRRSWVGGRALRRRARASRRSWAACRAARPSPARAYVRLP